MIFAGLWAGDMEVTVKQVTRIAVVLGVMLAITLSGCSLQGDEATRKGEPAAQATVQAPSELENIIWASGKLVPERWAYLGFLLPGQIETVDVAEGDTVHAGQILAALSSANLEAAVHQAEAALAAAQAQLAALAAPARPEDISAAQGALAAAQAQVDMARAGVATAQSHVATAQAQAGIAAATLKRVKAGSSAEVIAAAREQLEIALAQRNQAQAAYDRVAGDPEIGMRPEALALQQATAAAAAAQALYDAAVRGPTAEDVAVAQSQVNAANAAVRVAETGVATAQAGVAAADSGVVQAQARLDLLKAGARPEDISVAEAAVAQARAGLDAAKAALAQARISAPFDGTVGAVWRRSGEIVQPGQDLIALGEIGSMHVETTDLRETDVARLRVGQKVDVTFDALPNRVFTGTITRIAPLANTDKGSVNYTVIINLDDLDPALRWGMTAFVNIEAQ
jgi:multidrug efflux pump subunit AcrA (membrane-fusion protein)